MGGEAKKRDESQNAAKNKTETWSEYLDLIRNLVWPLIKH
jgi:hypothetical protein